MLAKVKMHTHILCQHSARAKKEFPSIPVVVPERTSEWHRPKKTWASCGKNVQADLISARATLCKEVDCRIRLLASPLCCSLFVLLLVLWTREASLKCWVSVCKALQEHVNADQYFDSKYNHEKGVKHSFFLLLQSFLFALEETIGPNPWHQQTGRKFTIGEHLKQMK